MHTRTLGHDLHVSAIGLGCMGMSQSYGPNPGDQSAMIKSCATPVVGTVSEQDLIGGLRARQITLTCWR
jgi:hypothetical protein